MLSLMSSLIVYIYLYQIFYEEGLINQSLNNQISEQISLSGIKVAYQV